MRITTVDMEDLVVAQTLVALGSENAKAVTTMTSVQMPIEAILAETGVASAGQVLCSDWFMDAITNLLVSKIYHPFVSWLPEGKIWRIHDVIGFENLVLPHMPVFRHVQRPVELFMTMLAIKGFEEVSRGPNSIAFYSKVR